MVALAHSLLAGTSCRCGCQRIIAKAMFLSDKGIGKLIPDDARKANGRVHAHDVIEDLLNRMCALLAYHMEPMQKGATFLFLEGDSPNPCFMLFAHVHHDDAAEAAREINDLLSKEHGLAAQAIRQKECVLLADCMHVPPGIDWVQTHYPPRFRGRAAAPVRILSANGHGKDIGAVCLDMKTPWRLSKEDELLMMVFADKIAAVWQLLNEHEPSGSTILSQAVDKAKSLLHKAVPFP